MIFVALAAAGAAGTLTRFGLDTALRRRWPDRPRLPILLVNVTGSLLLGLIVGLVTTHGVPSAVRTVAGTGFCASYTTFSTAVWETLGLLRERRWAAAVGHGLLTLVGTALAAALGLAVTSTW
ncbi:fluoride efflux transporter FluC [Kineococcus sp. SYSU DK003]|uniref:fluoride efflux transporter FluC n=1 Tax=Kineococcus sp. SYSU DK003 TaxID=3383124 RepID=UPI003D7EA6CB